MNITQAFERCIYSRGPLPMAPHFHENVELIYVKSGCARLNVGNSEYDLAQGRLALISETSTHSLLPAGDDYQRFYLLFSAEALRQATGDTALRVMLQRVLQSGQGLYELPPGDREQVEAGFGTILQERARQDSFSMDMAIASLKQILIRLCRASASAVSAPLPFSPEVAAVKASIETHLDQDVRIAELAAENYISPCYLSHRFKEQVGVSPKSYLLLCRMKRARELLSCTELSVAQVAFRCGFNDVNNFIRNFKNDSGETPKRYRMRCRSELG